MNEPNPFSRPLPGLPNLQLSAAADRIEAVSKFDQKQCEAAMQLPDLQVTVRNALKRRIRVLAKAKQ